MSLGGHDLFGPKSHKVQGWKKATEEKQVKMISCVFEDKAARKKTSASVCPPKSLSHQYTLDSLHPPKTKASCQHPPDHSFGKDSRPRPSSSSTGQSYVKDKQPVSQPFVPVAAPRPLDRVLPDKTRTKALNSIVPSTKMGGAAEK